MEIVHNPNKHKTSSLHSIRGGKDVSNILHAQEKFLLHQVSEAFTIITGGSFKRRNQSA